MRDDDHETLYVAEAKRTIGCAPSLAWALLADSNRWDRVVGCNPTTYAYEVLRDGDPTSRARVGSAEAFGKTTRWTEAGEWVEGRFMWGERRYLRGGVRRAGFRFRFDGDGGGALVEAEAYVACAARAASLGASLRDHFQSTLERYLEATDALVGRLAPSERPTADEPPVSTARRLLLATPADDLVGGPRTPPSEADLQFHLCRFAEAPVDEALRERLVDLLRSRSDDELTALRPFEIARAWGLSRRRVARAFLFAASAGLFDLRWQLVCPTCRVAADTRRSVEEIARVERCRDCDANFQVDFAANVEAVFAPNPAIRPVGNRLYCGGSPWFRPHVLALLTVEARGTRAAAARLPRGELVIRTLDNRRRATITLDAAPRELHLHLAADGIVPAATYVGEGAVDETMLIVSNATDGEDTLLVERAGSNADVALGSYVVTMPDFRDLFATEAPATGVDLSVGAITLLFSDLVGSTAMYERLGDARAFALVEEHFRDVQRILDDNEGTLVKTMGDAVMASFRSPARALQAALEMVPRAEAAGRRHGVDGLSLKIGLHHGEL